MQQLVGAGGYSRVVGVADRCSAVFVKRWGTGVSPVQN